MCIHVCVRIHVHVCVCAYARNAQFSGGMAGLLSFMLLHPIDVVKSMAQSMSAESGLTLSTVLREHYRAYGPRFLFNGFVPTCLRAFPVSAVIFYVYEGLTKALDAAVDAM